MLRIVRAGTIVLALGLVLAACGGTPPAHVGSTQFTSYVALGDSYTSAPLVPTTERDDGCLRSTHNYPSLLADELHVTTFTDASCSGARTKNMTTSQYPGVPAQFHALKKTTQLVTVGIGANDFNTFGRMTVGCFRAQLEKPHGISCIQAMTTHGQDSLLARIPQITDNVTKVLQAVHELSPHAVVVAVGYPQVVPSSGSCSALPLAATDYPYVLRVNRALNQAVHTAATRTHSTYVDVWGASKGHDICSSDPWINGVHTTGDALALHPFEVEQRAVADLVARAVS